MPKAEYVDHAGTIEALLALHGPLWAAIEQGAAADDAEKSALLHIDKGLKHLESVRAQAARVAR